MKRNLLAAILVLSTLPAVAQHIPVYTSSANELLEPFQQPIIPDCFNISTTETVIHTGVDSATGQVHQAVCWDVVHLVINIPNLWCNGQESCGGGAVGITGTLTPNKITKSQAAHVVTDSSGTDDGTHYVEWPDGLSTETLGLAQLVANSSSPGTVANETVCINGSGQAFVCGTSNTTGVAGVAVEGAGTSGNVRYCITQCLATFDNQTTIGHIAIESTTTIGQLHDTGSSAATGAVDNFIINSANAGAGTIASVDILTPRRVSVAINAAANPTLHIQTGLGDGVNSMTAVTYPMLYGGNKTSLTWTITSISCYTDNAGTSSLGVTNNAGTSLISGTCTCNNTKTNIGQACTQSGTTTLPPGDAFNFAFAADGTTKTTTWAIEVTQ